MGGGGWRGVWAKGQQIEHIKTFKFMLWKLEPEEVKWREAEGEERVVEITISVDDEGKLKCKYFDWLDPEHVQKRGGKGKGEGWEAKAKVKTKAGTETKEQRKLMLLSVLLFLLYLALRVGLNVVVVENEVVVEVERDTPIMVEF